MFKRERRGESISEEVGFGIAKPGTVMVNSNMMRKEGKLVVGAKLSFMFAMEYCEVM